ncbi:Cytosolic Fe-S cluster assembly factor NARFL [Zancudomyces culisetae]|uniref:Cytosolic Fe-S cluster assembly factor NARFL n=1 Tax=Zancudomyces culisetae TaxID=1213189 RepID=A0A1R1PVN7_ZANCU|nr:Cytosolic Fe-S cluster assembly factor NARFL [Zancudomyces culisetae]|eukprot:OMH85027.1 Cytosolic Fe-S cluster assembly factor NARFL [Zancudomyces culisetae]
MSFSQGIKLSNISDYLAPSESCVIPTTKKAIPNAGKDSNFTWNNAPNTTATATTAEINLSDCLACSGCITTAESVLVNHQSYIKVADLLLPKNSTKETNRVIFSLSPQSIVSIANKFPISLLPNSVNDVTSTNGENMADTVNAANNIGNITSEFTSLDVFSAIKILAFWLNKFGVYKIVDLGYGRLIYQQASYQEVLDRSRTTASKHTHLNPNPNPNKNPNKNTSTNNCDKGSMVISSWCPGVLSFIEKKYPTLINHLSRVKSPLQLTGAYVTQKYKLGNPSHKLENVENYHYQQNKPIPGTAYYHVGVLPCYDKKLESFRNNTDDSDIENPSKVNGSMVISSWCPGVLSFIEKKYPTLINHLSRVKSPLQLTGAYVTQKYKLGNPSHKLENVENYHYQQNKPIPGTAYYHVGVLPCYDKKLESFRNNTDDSDIENPSKVNVKDIDIVLSTIEFIQLLEYLVSEYRNSSKDSTTILQSEIKSNNNNQMGIQGIENINLNKYVEMFDSSFRSILEPSELSNTKLLTGMENELKSTSKNGQEMDISNNKVINTSGGTLEYILARALFDEISKIKSAGIADQRMESSNCANTDGGDLLANQEFHNVVSFLYTTKPIETSLKINYSPNNNDVCGFDSGMSMDVDMNMDVDMDMNMGVNKSIMVNLSIKYPKIKQSPNYKVIKISIMEPNNTEPRKVIIGLGIYGFKYMQGYLNKLSKIEPPTTAPTTAPKTAKANGSSSGSGSGSISNEERALFSNDTTFVEIGACPSGCINGGGQLKLSTVSNRRNELTKLTRTFSEHFDYYRPYYKVKDKDVNVNVDEGVNEGDKKYKNEINKVYQDLENNKLMLNEEYKAVGKLSTDSDEHLLGTSANSNMTVDNTENRAIDGKTGNSSKNVIGVKKVDLSW